MLLNIDKYLKEKRGAIHVGGHDGEERSFYSTFEKVVYFEPNTHMYSRLVKNISGMKNQMAINIGIHDTMKFADLNISNNDGQSSSLLELNLHKKYHPGVYYISKQKVTLSRLDSIFENILDASNYNFLNIDVQGVELNVIKSAGTFITNFDYVYTEVNDQELYKGCSRVEDIDAYLDQHGFYRVETHWTKNHWGDALYIKKS